MHKFTVKVERAGTGFGYTTRTVSANTAEEAEARVMAEVDDKTGELRFSRLMETWERVRWTEIKKEFNK